jgi:hypothetical protein
VEGLDAEAVERVLVAFCADVRRIFAAGLAQVRANEGSRSAAEANSKFDGFEGSFANLKDFHAGAEATLNLGYPNPETMKGIRLEHTEHPSVARLFVTPNYRIATCLIIEHTWAVDPDGPSKAVLDLLSRLRADRGAEGYVQAESRCTTRLGVAALSLVRGESKNVHIDKKAQTVTFRWLPLRLTSARSSEHGPLHFGQRNHLVPSF